MTLKDLVVRTSSKADLMTNNKISEFTVLKVYVCANFLHFLAVRPVLKSNWGFISCSRLPSSGVFLSS